VEYEDGEAMADGVAERIAAAIATGTSPADIAVLYRKNRLSRIVETALLRQGIPYRIKAGTDLLSYAEVRMMLAAGRMATNRRDVRALARLADLVPGLGAKGVGHMVAAGDEPLLQTGRLSAKAAQGVRELGAALEALYRRGPGELLHWREQTPRNSGGCAHQSSSAQGVRELGAALEALYRRGPGELLDWCEQTPLFRAWLHGRARASLQAAGRPTDPQEMRQALRPALA